MNGQIVLPAFSKGVLKKDACRIVSVLRNTVRTGFDRRRMEAAALSRSEKTLHMQRHYVQDLLQARGDLSPVNPNLNPFMTIGDHPIGMQDGKPTATCNGTRTMVIAGRAHRTIDLTQVKDQAAPRSRMAIGVRRLGHPGHHHGMHGATKEIGLIIATGIAVGLHIGSLLPNSVGLVCV